MKFSTYLEQIMGVSIYPVISLVLFVVFFAVVLYRTWHMNRQEIEEAKQIPFND